MSKWTELSAGLPSKQWSLGHHPSWPSISTVPSTTASVYLKTTAKSSSPSSSTSPHSQPPEDSPLSPIVPSQPHHPPSPDRRLPPQKPTQHLGLYTVSQLWYAIMVNIPSDTTFATEENPDLRRTARTDSPLPSLHVHMDALVKTVNFTGR